MVKVTVDIPALDFHDMVVWLKEFAPGSRFSDPSWSLKDTQAYYSAVVTFPHEDRAVLFKLRWG